MGDKKQVSVPATLEHSTQFGLWCKAKGMTQEQGFAYLMDNHVPKYKIELEAE